MVTHVLTNMLQLTEVLLQAVKEEGSHVLREMADEEVLASAHPLQLQGLPRKHAEEFSETVAQGISEKGQFTYRKWKRQTQKEERAQYFP